MMVPNQIKMQSFSNTGRGTYKASEVDEFLEQIYQNYCEMYADNSKLKKKFSSLADIITEYNANKNSIATALVNAQALADQTIKFAENAANELVEKAKNEAEEIYKSKTQIAEQYANEKTATADEYFKKAEAALESKMSIAKAEAEKYINEINFKAKEIIDDANAKAGKIVANAYADTKTAHDKADEFISNANEEYSDLRNELAKFKKETSKLISSISNSLEKIDVPDAIEIEIENTAEEPVEENTAKPVINEFSPDLTNEPKSYDIAESISSDDTADVSLPDMDSYVNEIFDSVKFDDNNGFISSAAGNKFRGNDDYLDIFSKTESYKDDEEEKSQINKF